MVGVLPVPLWVGKRKIGIRMDAPFEMRLPPEKIKAVLLAEVFQGNMEVGDREFVI